MNDMSLHRDEDTSEMNLSSNHCGGCDIPSVVYTVLYLYGNSF
jgi:hypothetical protein